MMRKLTARQRAELVGDLHVYGGALLFSLGTAWWFRPAGLISFGLFLCWLGLFWRGAK